MKRATSPFINNPSQTAEARKIILVIIILGFNLHVSTRYRFYNVARQIDRVTNIIFRGRGSPIASSHFYGVRYVGPLPCPVLILLFEKCVLERFRDQNDNLCS